MDTGIKNIVECVVKLQKCIRIVGVTMNRFSGMSRTKRQVDSEIGPQYHSQSLPWANDNEHLEFDPHLLHQGMFPD